MLFNTMLRFLFYFYPTRYSRMFSIRCQRGGICGDLCWGPDPMSRYEKTILRESEEQAEARERIIQQTAEEMLSKLGR